MARHSHWHNIQITKGKADAKRAGAFTKASKTITVAVKEGGSDPNFNFKLRMAIESAKAVNLPKDVIDRAIARGAGGGDQVALEEVLYEGFGPDGVAFLIEAVTDNRNRTVSELKTRASKNGGSLGNPGTVKWMFDKKAVVRVVGEVDELSLIEAGADDIRVDEQGTIILADQKHLQTIKEVLEKSGVAVVSAGIEFIPNTIVSIDDDIRAQLDVLVEAIEENDDVVNVYSNEA